MSCHDVTNNDKRNHAKLSTACKELHNKIICMTELWQKGLSFLHPDYVSYLNNKNAQCSYHWSDKTKSDLRISKLPTNQLIIAKQWEFIGTIYSIAHVQEAQIQSIFNHEIGVILRFIFISLCILCVYIFFYIYPKLIFHISQQKKKKVFFCSAENDSIETFPIESGLFHLNIDLGENKNVVNFFSIFFFCYEFHSDIKMFIWKSAYINDIASPQYYPKSIS